MVLDKTIHKAFRTHTILQTKPIGDFFYFTIKNLPILCIGFNTCKYNVGMCTIRTFLNALNTLPYNDEEN